MEKLINAVGRVKRNVGISVHVPGHVELMLEQNKFLLNELQRLNEDDRIKASDFQNVQGNTIEQTRESFDYQWNEFHEGVAMPSDADFMATLGNTIATYTALPTDWFKGKKVADIGCGAGRWSYGFATLGATVTSCDQSEWALKRTAELCSKYKERHSTQKIDLLTWSEPQDYDLAFCYGVVHHTGNTYRAMLNVASKVKSGGLMFLMIYGFPETLSDFRELNSYEDLRRELRNLSYRDRKRVLIEKFGATEAHGWFDAISPRINDLLRWDEIVDVLTKMGFTDIKRTFENRNHHVMARKR